MEVVGNELSGVVVGKILDLRPHPNAERIQLVDVDLEMEKLLRYAAGRSTCRLAILFL